MTSPDLYKTFDAEEPATTLEPGMSLAGRYTLIKQIGRGGMGVIWSAEEKAAGRKVVLKFVPSELKNFESAVAQLKESFQKIHGLQHQHICPVYTLEEDFSLGYYHVMKWLDGETLDEYVVRTVGRQKPLPFNEALRILRPVAKALDYAHGQRIIHRDIKPSNIFVVLDDKKSIRDVQVIDFGLASEIRSSLTRVSQVRFDTSGTRPYMAPEQWRGRPQSGPTDQYALAVVAYELLSGYLPFDGEDVQMLGNAILNFPPEPIRKMPKQVNAALLKALAKDGSERFDSCVKFMAALSGLAIPVAKKTSSVPPPVSPDHRPLATGHSSVPPPVPPPVLPPKQPSGSSTPSTPPVVPGVESLMNSSPLANSEWPQEQEWMLAEQKRQDWQLQQARILAEQKQKAYHFRITLIVALLLGFVVLWGGRQILVALRNEDNNVAANENVAPDGSPSTKVQAVSRNLQVTGPENWQASNAGERKVVTIDGVEYAFRWCPSGTFTMGSPAGEKDRREEETPHQVTLTKGFWMLETEVTQEMWESVMGDNPSNFKENKRLPVETVSWDDCQKFIKKLNDSLRAADVSRRVSGFKFCLPTEAQWEYACRAGTPTPFHFGSVLNGDKANCDGNYPYGTETKGKALQKTSVAKMSVGNSFPTPVPMSRGFNGPTPHPFPSVRMPSGFDGPARKIPDVDSYPANAWGLCDMHGNVWEWCSDRYGDYPSGVARDPVGPSSGTDHVLRGGGWSDFADACRSASRSKGRPSDKAFTIGFRLVLVSE